MFGYTGGFSVYAMGGGAELVHTVDSSGKAIDLTRENVELNFRDDPRHEAFAEDAFTFMNRIKDYIYDGKIDAAVALCKSSTSPASRMVEKGISRIGRPLNDVSTAIENLGKLEIYKLEKGLPTLATVAGAAPMIGFLGTVIGMIKAFYDMSNAGNNIDVSLLSNGIYTAMVTTVAGLIVGILAFFAYNMLVAKVEKVIFRLEATSTEFMDILNEPVK